jgi:Lrp/AsnC family leucine-responsive transcriptional regulator
MKLDEYDAKILEILQRDARASVKRIASESRLTPPTVSARMKSLEQMGIVKGYRAEIPPSSLGQGLIFFLLRTKPSEVEEVTKALVEIPLVREVHAASGGRIVAIAMFRGISDQENLMNEIGKIQAILEYDHYVIMETKKKESWAIISEGAQVSISCFYCKRPIEGTPYKIRVGGRDHYLCCPICEKEYRKKYSEIKERAEKNP